MRPIEGPLLSHAIKPGVMSNQPVAWFAGKDVAFAPILDFREALATPHVAERGLVVHAAGAHQLAPSIRFAGGCWTPRDAPALNDG